jgi:S1-C subfamily serine protease
MGKVVNNDATLPLATPRPFSGGILVNKAGEAIIVSRTIASKKGQNAHKRKTILEIYCFSRERCR